MINSDSSIIVHRGEQTFFLPQQRREDTGRDGAGTLGSWLFRGTGKEQVPQQTKKKSQEKGIFIT